MSFFRLRVHYDDRHFPEDLLFQKTSMNIPSRGYGQEKNGISDCGERKADKRMIGRPGLLKNRLQDVIRRNSTRYLLEQSPIRFPSTRIVTRIPFPAVGVAFRTTEKEVLETVPSTRVTAWGPSMS